MFKHNNVPAVQTRDIMKHLLSIKLFICCISIDLNPAAKVNNTYVYGLKPF